jgi:uncharacterized RDD family membrane protein YckC
MSDTQESPIEPEHILDDVDYTARQASSGKRFGDYIIDRIIFYLLWQYGLVKVAVKVIYAIRVPLDNRLAIWVVSYLMAATAFVLFLGTFETLTKGKTPGKYLMGTLAIHDDGTRLRPGTAMLRALSRLVPFEVFSALGRSLPYPWHDRWTHTIVIDERLSNLPPE